MRHPPLLQFGKEVCVYKHTGLFLCSSHYLQIMSEKQHFKSILFQQGKGWELDSSNFLLQIFLSRQGSAPWAFPTLSHVLHSHMTGSNSFSGPLLISTSPFHKEPNTSNINHFVGLCM